MREVRFKCKDCGHEFVQVVVDPQEAREKQIPTTAVICPKCGSDNLKRT